MDMKFRGTIYSVGIGISVLKQNYEIKKNGVGGGSSSIMSMKLVDEDECKYVEDLEKEKLQAITGKCVLGDPGRRDLTYTSCMKTAQLRKNYCIDTLVVKMTLKRKQENLQSNLRKKLLRFINRIQAEERLARNLRKKFSKDALLVLGDWSAGHIKLP